MIEREEGKFQPVAHADLIENIGEMAFDGFFADAELRGDVAVAAALDDGAYDFKLARGEAEVRSPEHGVSGPPAPGSARGVRPASTVPA